MTVSIPPLVPGNPRGWLRVQLAVESDDTPSQPETHVFLGIRWWGSDSEHTVSVNTQQTNHEIDAVIPCVIRTSRSKFVHWLRDAPRRQALEVLYRIVDKNGSSRELCGYVPLASLIERLTVVELSTVSCRDIRVGLRERSSVSESPLGSPHMYIRCNIDVSFDSGDRIASERVTEQGAVDQLADLSISSKGVKPIVLGRDSLDELGADPGWPSHARRMHVYVVSVRFDQSYASLHLNDDARVYLTLGTSKDGSDQQVTSSIPFHQSGSPSCKMLEASWDGDEVVSFDPRTSCENSPKALDRDSTDSHMSAQSGAVPHSRKMSQSPVSPILRVGLWKSVKILDQFHTFSSQETSQDGVSPYDGLIGSAVIAATGALSQEEGIEIPLYNSELKKSGTVHLKIVTNAAENVSVDESSALNYELLSSMDTLARHVAPDRADETLASDKKVRYAMSDSDDSACVGIAYEGAVSCSDDEGVHLEAPKADKVPGILSDDWIFNIEKSTC